METWTRIRRQQLTFTRNGCSQPCLDLVAGYVSSGGGMVWEDNTPIGCNTSSSDSPCDRIGVSSGGEREDRRALCDVVAGVETFSRQGGLLGVTNPFVTRSCGKRGGLFGEDKDPGRSLPVREIPDFLLLSGPGVRRHPFGVWNFLAMRNAILRLLGAFVEGVELLVRTTGAFVERMGCFIEGVSSHRRSGWARQMGVFCHHSSSRRGTWDQAVNAGGDPGT